MPAIAGEKTCQAISQPEQPGRLEDGDHIQRTEALRLRQDTVRDHAAEGMLQQTPAERRGK